VDGGREYQGGYSALDTLLFGVKRDGSAGVKGMAGFSAG